MEASIKITGLEEFIKKVAKSEGEVSSTINRGIKKSIFHLEREAIGRTPVDTGFLRNGYKERFSNLFGTLYNIRKYAIFVHEGTRFIKGNPFLGNTLDAEGKQINLIMNKEMYKYLSILK